VSTSIPPRPASAQQPPAAAHPDPRLVAALERALATQAVVTLIDAPPGFGGAGKITALHPTAVEVRVYEETSSPTLRVPLAELAWAGEGYGWLVVSLGEPAAAAKPEPTAADLVLARINDWTYQHGAALKPPGADTYGEGMRNAKRQVADMLQRLGEPAGAVDVARYVLWQHDRAQTGGEG